MSKAIVFDLDETLRSLDTSIGSEGISVILRPKITELLEKLSKEKEKGVDSIIFTSASRKSVNDYFIKKIPEKYRDVFTEIISRENYLMPKPGTRESYLYRLGANKMITVLDYDEILFFDDNLREYQFLKELYNVDLGCKYPIPDKHVTLARLPFLPRRESEMYALKEMAKDIDKKGKNEVSLIIKKYFELMTEEPGCKIMISMIDDFVSNKHQNCFTFFNGTEEFNDYNEEARKYCKSIDNILDKDVNLSDKYRDYEDEYYDKMQTIDIDEML